MWFSKPKHPVSRYVITVDGHGDYRVNPNKAGMDGKTLFSARLYFNGLARFGVDHPKTYANEAQCLRAIEDFEIQQNLNVRRVVKEVF